MFRGLRVALFRPIRRLPVGTRRFLVRRVAPCDTAGAVCRIERSDGAVLLVTQSYRRHWSLPGGLLHRGEEPADAVRREVREEVGLDIEVEGGPVVVFDARARRIDFVFVARLPAGAGDEATAVSAEVVDVRWFPADALPRLGAEARMALTAVSPKEVPPAGR